VSVKDNIKNNNLIGNYNGQNGYKFINLNLKVFDRDSESSRIIKDIDEYILELKNCVKKVKIDNKLIINLIHIISCIYKT
jgi:hypothetical protein